MVHLLIQIQRWLMQPHVWRFVGFASTAVGLLCYALSSSFNNLFGHWNLLKIFLYSVFSVIISVAVWFANIWPHSPNLQFKAHMAILALTITSIYSFFFDKASSTKKPDAYGLISCASFAMMSLSLSRQTHCGFEVDLLYFFLAALIVQLMKIQLWLGVAGVGFSYSLVVLRSFLDSPVSGRLQDPHHVAIQVDPQQSNSTTSPSANLLIVQHPDSTSDAIVRKFMSAIKHLELVNLTLISALWYRLNRYISGRVHQIPEAMLIDHNFLMDQLPSVEIEELSENVERMIAGGFEKKCLDEYSNFRRTFLEECLLGFELKKSSQPPELEERIKNWVKLSHIALRILLPNERRLCDRVFSDSSRSDRSFMEICSEVTNYILDFADNFANRSPPSNLSPNAVQVFETLHDLIPQFDLLFSDDCSVPLKTRAITVMKGLGESIRIRDYYLKELNHLIDHDTQRESVPGGIYPITVKVMNRLNGFLNPEGTLALVLRDYPKVAVTEGMPSSLYVASLIELLENHLEVESRANENPALGYVFLMNNGRYIAQKVRYIQLDITLGDDWVQRRTARVHENLEHYKRHSWDEVLGFLKLDSNEEVNVTAESIKEKLNLFNKHFKEICNVQRTWFVNDEELRKEIITSLENILFPAYGIFIERTHNVLGQHAYEHIRYSFFEIEELLNGLFGGRVK